MLILRYIHPMAFINKQRCAGLGGRRTPKTHTSHAVNQTDGCQMNKLKQIADALNAKPQRKSPASKSVPKPSDKEVFADLVSKLKAKKKAG